MMRDHFEAAAAEAGLTLNEIRGPRRDRVAYRARQVAYAACRDAGFTLSQIGKFANRDHTTVLNGLQRYDARNNLRQTHETALTKRKKVPISAHKKEETT